MDVTAENFAHLLPLIENSISRSDFIGFDTEFSGMNPHFFSDYKGFPLDMMTKRTTTTRLRIDIRS
jgi:hypothetical protein